jgi:hypothetical protein
MAHCEKDLRYREPRQEPAIHRRVLRRKPAASISIEQCLILRMVLVRSLQLGVQQWIEHETQDCRYRHQESFNSAIRVRRAMTAVAKSTIERSPSTTTAPAIVPIAAAVTPSTKAFTLAPKIVSCSPQSRC